MSRLRLAPPPASETTPEPRYLLREVAEQLDVSRATIERAVREGQLESFQFAGKKNVNRAALLDYLRPRFRQGDPAALEPGRKWAADLESMLPLKRANRWTVRTKDGLYLPMSAPVLRARMRSGAYPHFQIGELLMLAEVHARQVFETDEARTVRFRRAG